MMNFGCLPDPKDVRDYRAKVKLAERPIAVSAMPPFLGAAYPSSCHWPSSSARKERIELT